MPTHNIFFAGTVLMIRPSGFSFNTETAQSNYFQMNIATENVFERALKEFDDFVLRLKNSGIHVVIFDDDVNSIKPDAVFPNNWFSTHAGKLITYPMLAQNRRLERRKDIIKKLQEDFGYGKLVDLTQYEKQNLFLEGTGSLVFNHKAKKIYAALSSRTDAALVNKVAVELKYEPVIFSSYDEDKNPVYHTNVMLTIANGFAVVCLESITDEEEKRNVIKNLTVDGLIILEIDFEQLHNFCGNMLQLVNNKGEHVLVMSDRAKQNFSTLFLTMMEKHTKIISVSLDVIETVGGGGARCMLAEIFHNH